MGKKFSKSWWRYKLWLRDPYCYWCGEPLELKDVTLEHVKPRWMRGRNNAENLQIACSRCNSAWGVLLKPDARVCWPRTVSSNRPLDQPSLCTEHHSAA